MKKTFTLILLILSSNFYGQYLSGKLMVERKNSQYVYVVKSSTDGSNRQNNTTFSNKWTIGMFDYAGGNKGYFNTNALNTSISKGGLAHSNAIGANYFDGIWEWGYSFYNIPAGNSTVLPSTFSSSNTTKQQAYNNIFNWVKSSLNSKWSQKTWLSSINGFYNFNHMGLSAANESQFVDIVGSEVGENITGTSLQIAFTRGAARQYQKPWMVDLSSWYGGGQGTGVRDYTAFMNEMAQGVQSADFSGNRVGVRMSNGDILLKEGLVNSNWITIANGASQFDIEGNRIGVLYPNGEFWMKEGSPSSNFNLLAQSVSKFQLKGSRVGILIGSFLAVKEPYSNSNWVNFTSGIKDFQISNNRLAMTTTGNVLKAQNANLNSTIYTINTDVSSYFITDNYLAYIKNDKNLFLINGSVSSPSVNLAANVTKVKIFENRIVFLKSDKSLWLSIAGNTPINLGANVIDFELDGNRIAKIQTNNELYIHTGNNYSYLNTEYTDEGFRFVSESVKQVFLENTTSRLGFLSTASTNNLFVKTNPLYLNEAGLSNFWYEGGAAAGHSNSLTKRIQFASYFNGANIFQTEASNVNYFLGSFKDNSGKYLSMSPLGKVGQEFYNFTNNVMPNRGIPFQSVAIMLPKEHGINYKTWSSQNNWVYSYLSPNNADLMNKALIKSIWGTTLNAFDPSENKYMGNNPYGDIFDILIQDCPLNVMKEYPMIIVSGDWYPSANECQKLKDYVTNGGNLVLSAAQRCNFTDAELGSSFGTPFGLMISNCSGVNDNFVSQTSVSNYVQDWVGTGPGSSTTKLMKCNNNNDVAAFSNKMGNGNIIVVAPFFMRNETLWTKLLQQLITQPEITPFKFNGDVQFAYTFEGDSIWNIFMTNNKGVSKNESTSAFETIDETLFTNANFTLQEKNKIILSVKEVTKNWNNYPFSGNTVANTLAPGEIRVLQIKTGSLTPKTTIAQETKRIISLFPNPSNGSFNLTGTNEKQVIKVFNLQGSEIQSFESKGVTNSIDLTNLPSAQYIITIIENNKIIETINWQKK